LFGGIASTGLELVKVTDIRMFFTLSSWHSSCDSSPGLFNECRTASSGCRPFDQANQLRLLVRL